MSYENIDTALHDIGKSFIEEKTYFDGGEVMLDIIQMANSAEGKIAFVNFTEATVSDSKCLTDSLETAIESYMEHLRFLFKNLGVDLSILDNVILELQCAKSGQKIFMCAEDDRGQLHRIEVMAA